MDLLPKLPPGRANRKALAYTAEIHRLRSAGYSFEAIRLALREVGVEVSSTTVKREAAKKLAMPRGALQAPLSLAASAAAGPPSEVPSTTQQANEGTVRTSFVGDRRTGKEIAEEFMKDRITNPLMQQRTRNEDRSA